jgi:D-arabinose 1-dehydrogenase-like Zn-dependent alcohol dehydrogenase
MKAWHFSNVNEPLVQVELPDPRAGQGEVVVKVRAAGLCHTDVGVLHDEGWLSTLAYRPIVMGHEVAGEIAEVGDGVTDWAVGDRVASARPRASAPRDSSPMAASASRSSAPPLPWSGSPTTSPSPSARPAPTPG